MTGRLPAVILSAQGVRALEQGNTIIPADLVSRPSDTCDPGSLVTVLSPSNTLMGTGYFNALSRIPLRMLTDGPEPVDADFWSKRIESAYRYRQQFYCDTDSYRVIFGESDGFPGLVADWYSGVLVVQITTAGMERLFPLLLPLIKEQLSPRALILSCDSLARKKEGLTTYRKVEFGRGNGPFQAEIDGLQQWIDPLTGHKTGFFLDHRLNRVRGAMFCKGKRVLDMFCYSGDFGIRAAGNSAESVTAVDIFNPAIELGKKTAADHGLTDRTHFIRAEAIDFLSNACRRDTWDVIFLDPPSWVRGAGRSRRNLNTYRKVNRLALQRLAPNGILITSICSFHVTRNDFFTLLGRALHESGRIGRVFETGSASPDHPVKPGVPGMDYLKCFFLQMTD
jgi:23S rRNA (cytosine1962-C5)-methyltransferase